MSAAQKRGAVPDDDDDIPELEDMSEELSKIKMLPQTTKPASNTINEDYTKTTEELQTNVRKETDELDKRLAESLAKKGLGYVDTSSTAGKPKEKTNPLEFKEVQDNMKAGNLGAYVEQTKGQWLTPDLLQNIQKNPNLMQSLADPEISQAIALMQVRPEEAKKKYQNNEKVTRFMVEFSKLMGGHFESLSKKEDSQTKKAEHQPLIKETSSKPLTTSASKTTAPSKPSASSAPTISTTDPALAKKLENPTVKAIMADKPVLAFLEHLQKGNPVDFFQLARSDPELAHKLRILIEMGILNTHAQPPK